MLDTGIWQRYSPLRSPGTTCIDGMSMRLNKGKSKGLTCVSSVITISLKIIERIQRKSSSMFHHYEKWIIYPAS